MSFKECCECGSIADFKHNDVIHNDENYYCEECMLNSLGIEVEEVISYVFRKEGDYIGSSDDYTHTEIIKEVAKDENQDIEHGLFRSEGE